MSKFLSPTLAAVTPYTPGEQPQDQQYIKLNTNESPYLPSPAVIAAVSEHEVEKLRLYSDPACADLLKAAAAHFGLQPEQIMPGNGSDENLFFALRAFCDADHPLAYADITYGCYGVWCGLMHIPSHIIPLKEDFTLDPKDYYGLNQTIVLANPNAPTGIALPRAEIEGILKANPNNVVIVDEAYVDFGGESCVPLIDQYENLVPEIELFGVDVPRIRRIIDSIPEDGYIAPNYVQALLHAAGIPLVDEFVSDNREEIVAFARRCGFPVVAKVVGPVHKSDVGGVVLNIKSEQHLALEFDRMMQIPDARAIMVQPMLKGTELFVGAKYEEKFGHVVLCGLGGIFVEVLKDVSSGLAPLSYEEAYSMIHSLRAYKIIQGTRGQKGVNEDKFAEIIVRLSTLLRFATEIKEMDINPLLATEKAVVAVDARIRIEK